MSILQHQSVAPLALALLVSGCVEKPDMQADFPSGPIGYTLAPEPHPQPTQRTTIVITSEGATPGGEPTVSVESDQTLAEAAPEVDEGYEDQDPSAQSDFRATLEPYGEWTEDPNYGQVWVPAADVVGGDFAPYVSSGHWAYDNDYTWVSDYDWGWAPFHYGRWVYGGYGWSWIPGRKYAGAWVTWRTGANAFPYVGWAPLPPAWGWRHGRAFPLGFRPTAPYVFCGTDHLFASSVSGHVVRGSQVGDIASHTTPFAPHGGSGSNAPHFGHRGPPPASLRIPEGAIARSPTGDRGLLHAHAYSQPGPATAMGAHAPVYRSSIHDAVARGPWGGGYVGHAQSFGQPEGAYYPQQRFGGAGRAGTGMGPGMSGRSFGAPTYRPPMMTFGAPQGFRPGHSASRSSPYYAPGDVVGPVRGEGRFDPGGGRGGPSFGGPGLGGVGGGVPARPGGGGRGGGRR